MAPGCTEPHLPEPVSLPLALLQCFLLRLAAKGWLLLLLASTQGVGMDISGIAGELQRSGNDAL
jgi:hypothetical protein